MRKIYALGALILCCASLFSSCSSLNSTQEVEMGSVFGVVTDYASGSPVANANVSLLPGGESTLTGYDGMYEFLDIPDGSYRLKVSKAEYTDLLDDYVIIIKQGRRVRRDVQIEKLPVYLRLTDTDGRDISALDFGSQQSIKAFNIFNNGTVGIDCSIGYSCSWIKSVYPLPKRISPGQTVIVNVEIDRSKLNPGINKTELYVTSNNGGNLLEITAMGMEVLPNVVTLPVTYMDGTINPWCNTYHGRVTEAGNPPYHKRGFCISSSNPNPTIQDRRIEVPGTGVGDFSYIDWDIPDFKQKYYVRAWVEYGSDNKVIYGEVQTFVFNDI